LKKFVTDGCSDENIVLSARNKALLKDAALRLKTVIYRHNLSGSADFPTKFSTAADENSEKRHP
jgi:hypothetical protein